MSYAGVSIPADWACLICVSSCDGRAPAGGRQAKRASASSFEKRSVVLFQGVTLEEYAIFWIATGELSALTLQKHCHCTITNAQFGHWLFRCLYFAAAR